MAIETAILTLLRADATLAALLSEMKDETGEDAGIPAVFVSLAKGPSLDRYVIIHHGTEWPTYTFGNTEVFADEQLLVLSYTKDDLENGKSDRELADEIQARIRFLLHNALTSFDDRTMMLARRGPRDHYQHQVVNSENETYFVAGCQWFFEHAPD